ncbi:hypothetical protein [Micromonospora sp. NPDC005189]
MASIHKEILIVSSADAHDNASMQVFDQRDGHSRLVWIHDVLPR